MNKIQYTQQANLFKVLSDSNRLQIINLLASEEKCACELLEKFSITQPTLSHHMKTLLENNFIFARKDGNWMYYRLNNDKMKDIINFLNNICQNNNNSCNCKE